MKPVVGTRINAGWLDEDGLQQIFQTLTDEKNQTLAVGGAVRNTLMGESVSDVDLSTTLLPQEVIERLEARKIKTVPTGIEHGTVTAVTANATYEITTLREDIETDGRHAVVRFGKNWVLDAMRRDLTINALYCNADGEIFDPLDGLADVEKREVRFIGDAATRIDEDALRILRFFRFFAQYGSGRPDANGLKACTAKKEAVRSLSAERVWAEFKKLLGAKDPGRALLWMRTTGVLKAILPETEKWGIDSIPALIRVEETYGESVAFSPDPLTRLMTIIPPHIEMIEALSARLKLSNKEISRLKDWVISSPLPANLSVDSLPERLYRGPFIGLVDALKIEAAQKETGGNEQAVAQVIDLIAFAKDWKKPIFPVQGSDLIELGMEPGKEMGETLKRLENDWVESGFLIDKENLLKTIEQN